MPLKPFRRSETRTDRINIKHLRITVLSTVIILVLFGEIGKLGVGNLGSLTIAGLTLMSPLEFLEVTLASQTLLPIGAWYSAIAILFAAVVFGRFFCGWVCPFALLRIIFRVKERSEDTRLIGTERSISHSRALGQRRATNSVTKGIRTTGREKKQRYSVLAGVLGLSALLRIPFFLQFWPIGLFFGFMFAIVRLFSTHQPSLELVVFPALLALESLCEILVPFDLPARDFAESHEQP